MPTTYKITVEEIAEITGTPGNSGTINISLIKRTLLQQEVESIDLQAIFAAINPKPKRARRTKAELAKENKP